MQNFLSEYMSEVYFNLISESELRYSACPGNRLCPDDICQKNEFSQNLMKSISNYIRMIQDTKNHL